MDSRIDSHKSFLDHVLNSVGLERRRNNSVNRYRDSTPHATAPSTSEQSKSEYCPGSIIVTDERPAWQARHQSVSQISQEDGRSRRKEKRRKASQRVLSLPRR